jgi:thiopeptide-type bacteriocin biosynthesis protein
MVWKSWHIKPNEVEDVFLVRVLKPFLRDIIWSEPQSKAFYIRYNDAESGPHLRFRVFGGQDWLENVVDPQLKIYFEGKCSFTNAIYTPEPERFGGMENMPWAEAYFKLSTRMALMRIGRVPYVYGDAMFDTLRMHLTTMKAAGYELEDAKNYFLTLRNQWAPRFIFEADGSTLSEAGLGELFNTFDDQLEPQKAVLTQSLSDMWYYLKQNLFDKQQPEWEGWYQSSRTAFSHLYGHMETALPHFIHLHNNRMGITNYDEVFLCHILAEVL